MIYLTSSVASVSKHLYENYLEELNLKTVAFIDTAAEPERGKEDVQWLADDRRSLVDCGYEVTDFTFTGKEPSEVESTLEKFDILYMSGGSTYYLLQQIQQTKSAQIIRGLLRKGKAYIGTSAGSIVAGPHLFASEIIGEIDDAPGIDGDVGLRLTDASIFPHWGSEAFKESYLSNRLEEMYTDAAKKIILLNDNQYVAVQENGDTKIVDTRMD